MQIETKPFYLSTGFWGIILTFIAGILAKRGYKLSPTFATDTAQTICELLAYVVGPMMALVGRWKATTPLSTAGQTKSVPPPSAFILALLLPAILFSSSGCSSAAPAAKQVSVDAALSLATYRVNMERITDAFIADYRTSQRQTADRLAEDALESIKKPDGSASVDNVQRIFNRRLQAYADIETVAAQMKAKTLLAARDADTAANALAGLSGYWDKTSTTASITNQATDAAIQLVQTYLARSSVPKSSAATRP